MLSFVVVCCLLLFVVCGSVFVVGCLLFVVRLLLSVFVVCCVLFVVHCYLVIVDDRLLCVVYMLVVYC